MNIAVLFTNRNPYIYVCIYNLFIEIQFGKRTPWPISFYPLPLAIALSVHLVSHCTFRIFKLFINISNLYVKGSGEQPLGNSVLLQRKQPILNIISWFSCYIWCHISTSCFTVYYLVYVVNQLITINQSIDHIYNSMQSIYLTKIFFLTSLFNSLIILYTWSVCSLSWLKDTLNWPVTNGFEVDSGQYCSHFF